MQLALDRRHSQVARQRRQLSEDLHNTLQMLNVQSVEEVQSDPYLILSDPWHVENAQGACSTCTVNQMTLKSGVEMIIKKHVPEIEKVISVEI